MRSYPVIPPLCRSPRAARTSRGAGAPGRRRCAAPRRRREPLDGLIRAEWLAPRAALRGWLKAACYAASLTRSSGATGSGGDGPGPTGAQAGFTERNASRDARKARYDTAMCCCGVASAPAMGGFMGEGQRRRRRHRPPVRAPPRCAREVFCGGGEASPPMRLGWAGWVLLRSEETQSCALAMAVPRSMSASMSSGSDMGLAPPAGTRAPTS